MVDGLRHTELSAVVDEVRTLVERHYFDTDVAARICQVLDTALAEDRYPADPRALADAVSRDLQSVNGDKHLRLLFHEAYLPERAPGDDAEEYASMARWAEQTCGGVGQLRRLAGNVGHLDLQPIIFPAVISAEVITAALSLLAHSEALILDLRGCLGGDPSAVAFLISYLCDEEPVRLTGLQRRGDQHVRQAWTQAYLPGRRFGGHKPVYVLTSASTFSGGEAVAYDLQQLGRATLIGERTRGGAHPREAFRVHPHLEATIPVARAVNPISGGNWEGVGVGPDIETTADAAFTTAHRLALAHVAAGDGPPAAEARAALDSLDSAPPMPRQGHAVQLSPVTYPHAVPLMEGADG